MGFDWGSAGLGGGAFGMLGGSGLFDDGSDEARRRNLQMLKTIQQMYGRVGSQNPQTLFGQQNQGFNKAERTQQQAVGIQKKAGEQAQGAIAGQGAEAYKQINAQGAQAASATNQRAVSYGLGGTSGAQAMNAGARFNTQRALGGLGAQLGGLHAQTAMSSAQATTGALSQLAQLYGARGSANAQLGSQLGNTLSQYQFAPGQSMFQQLAPVLGTAAGFAMGGMG